MSFLFGGRAVQQPLIMPPLQRRPPANFLYDDHISYGLDHSALPYRAIGLGAGWAPLAGKRLIWEHAQVLQHDSYQ